MICEGFSVRTKWIAKKHDRIVNIIVSRIRSRLSMVKRWGTYEDLKQEATLMLHEIIQKDKYDPAKSKEDTYYGRALWNNLIAHIARTSVVKVSRHNLLATGRTKLVQDWWQVPDGSISYLPHETRERLEEEDRVTHIALQCLSTSERRIVDMKIDGKRNNFIAAAMGVSRYTVKKGWNESLVRIREVLLAAGVDHCDN